MEWDIATQALDCEYTAENESDVSNRNPRAYLKVHYPTNIEEYPIYQGKTIIGRGEGCDIQILSTFLSREHVSIDITGDVCLIHDMKSSNKTKRNGTVLIPDVRYELCDKDTIHFGALRCSFKKIELKKDETVNNVALDDAATLEPDDATDLESNASDNLLAGDCTNPGPNQSQFLNFSGSSKASNDTLSVEIDGSTLPVTSAVTDDVTLPVKIIDDNATLPVPSGANNVTIPVTSTIVADSTLPIDRGDISSSTALSNNDATLLVCHDNITMDVVDPLSSQATVAYYNQNSSIKNSSRLTADESRRTVVSMVLATPAPPLSSNNTTGATGQKKATDVPTITLVSDSDTSSTLDDPTAGASWSRVKSEAGIGLDTSLGGSRYVPASDTEEEDEAEEPRFRTMAPFTKGSETVTARGSLDLSGLEETKLSSRDASLNLDDPKCSQKLRMSSVFAPGYGSRPEKIVGEGKLNITPDDEGFCFVASSQVDESQTYDEPTQPVDFQAIKYKGDSTKLNIDSTLLNVPTQDLLMATTQCLTSDIISTTDMKTQAFLEMETQNIVKIVGDICKQNESTPVTEIDLDAPTQFVGNFTTAVSTSQHSSNDSEPYTKPKNKFNIIERNSEEMDDLTQPCVRAVNSSFSQSSESDALTQPCRQTTFAHALLRQNTQSNQDGCRKNLTLYRNDSESDLLTQPCRQQNLDRGVKFEEVSESQPFNEETGHSPHETSGFDIDCIPESELFTKIQQFQRSNELLNMPSSENDHELTLIPDSQDNIDVNPLPEKKNKGSEFNIPKLSVKPAEKSVTSSSNRTSKKKKLFAVLSSEEDTDIECLTQPARASPRKVARMSMNTSEKVSIDNAEIDIDAATQPAEISPTKIPNMSRHLFVKEKQRPSIVNDFVMDERSKKVTKKTVPVAADHPPQEAPITNYTTTRGSRSKLELGGTLSAPQPAAVELTTTAAAGRGKKAATGGRRKTPIEPVEVSSNVVSSSVSEEIERHEKDIKIEDDFRVVAVEDSDVKKEAPSGQSVKEEQHSNPPRASSGRKNKKATPVVPTEEITARDGTTKNKTTPPKATRGHKKNTPEEPVATPEEPSSSLPEAKDQAPVKVETNVVKVELSLPKEKPGRNKNTKAKTSATSLENQTTSHAPAQNDVDNTASIKMETDSSPIDINKESNLLNEKSGRNKKFTKSKASSSNGLENTASTKIETEVSPSQSSGNSLLYVEAPEGTKAKEKLPTPKKTGGRQKKADKDEEKSAPIASKGRKGMATKSKTSTSDMTNGETSSKSETSSGKDSRKQMDSDSLTAADSELSFCSSTRFRDLKKYKILFTGLDERPYQKVVKELGGEVVNSAHCATHLVTDQVRRTVKFLCCLARGLPIVIPSWITASKLSGAFIDSSSYLVTEHQADFHMNLSQSLQTARRHRVFSDWTLLATLGTRPGPDQLREMTLLSGADFLDVFPFQKKGLKQIALVTCDSDLAAKHSLVLEARERHVPIVSVEFVLSALMKQTIELDPYLLEPVSTSGPCSATSEFPTTSFSPTPSVGEPASKAIIAPTTPVSLSSSSRAGSRKRAASTFVTTTTATIPINEETTVVAKPAKRPCKAAKQPPIKEASPPLAIRKSTRSTRSRK